MGCNAYLVQYSGIKSPCSAINIFGIGKSGIEKQMSEKKKFLLRLDANIHAALEKWAADDLRSINAQIEFLLKDALKKASRLKENNPSN